jgi:hypothetical protein
MCTFSFLYLTPETVAAPPDDQERSAGEQSKNPCVFLDPQPLRQLRSREKVDSIRFWRHAYFQGNRASLMSMTIREVVKQHPLLVRLS